MGRKHCEKRIKCWLSALSPLPTMFSKGIFFRVFISQDCVVKSLQTKVYCKKKPQENEGNGESVTSKSQFLALQTNEVSLSRGN